MENKRLFLIISLLFVSYIMTQEWTRDYGPKLASSAQENSASSAEIPALSPLDEQDEAMVPTELALSAADQASLPILGGKTEKIRVITDVLDVLIDTKGGKLVVADLVTYPISIEALDEPFRILSTGGNYFIAENGLQTFADKKLTPLDRKAIFSTEKKQYRLEEGSDVLTVKLFWENQHGLAVTKTYIFQRGSFLINVRNTLKNTSGENWSGTFARTLKRTQAQATEQSNAFINTYTGGVIYTEKDKFEKISFDDMLEQNVARDNTGGWIAMIQHYFLAAWVPAETDRNRFYSITEKHGATKYVLGLNSRLAHVEDQAQATFSSHLYVGPKLQHTLEEISEGLDLTVDYGVLTFLAQPLYWLLDLFHSLFGNWGWAIIFVTIVIKLVFYKLSEASYVSMANMRKLTPKLQSLKERHGSDRTKMNQAMMELYKKEKINPLGGCLPILVQIPVFIALYWVLLESVELRQAGFILWIHDLSIADPYYVLPLLMGASMFVQQKLNPAPLDPIQAKVMMMLPIIFTVFFALFPAGLVLYWVVNNLLSIAQQWVITKRIAGKTLTKK